MCGIVGTFRFDGCEVDRALLTRQTRLLSHRGPDASAIWTNGLVGFGHARLSIIDVTDAGAQPMHSPDGRVSITYNGELYNVDELRRLLPERLPLRGHSDTEVLVRVIAALGRDVLDRLEGMFAFAIYDAAAREVWLVRDAFGVKPLYYHINSRRIVFASEIKALLADPETPRRPNLPALRQHLLLGYALDPETAFEGVMRVPQGHALRIRPDGTSILERYSALERLVDLPVTGLHDALRDSVLRQSVSDVPLGLFLSAGLDSSLIAAMLAESGRTADFTAFNVGDAPDDSGHATFGEIERHVAELTARRFDLRLVQLDGTSETAPSIATMIGCVEEPIANPSNALIDMVCREAHGVGTTVLMSGHGGDEAFAGYRRHVWARYLSLAQRMRLGGALGTASAFFSSNTLTRMADSLDNRRWPHPLISVVAIGWDLLNQPKLCGDWFVREQIGDTVSPLLTLLARWRGFSLLKQLMLLDMHSYMSAQNLINMDKVSMRHSIEVRVPFLHRPLVAIGLQAPDHALVRHFRNKALLRQLGRKVLPPEVSAGRKLGFGPTQAALMQNGGGARPPAWRNDGASGPLRHWRAGATPRPHANPAFGVAGSATLRRRGNRAMDANLHRRVPSRRSRVIAPYLAGQ